MASGGTACPLRGRHSPDKGFLPADVHRSLLERHRDHSSLWLTLQDRAQLQTGYPSDRGIRLSFLDDGHDPLALSGSRHTAQTQPFEVVVRYPHHPLAGERIPVIRCLKYANVPHFVVQGPDGCSALLPVWMTERYAASLPLVETPRLSIDALRALSCLINAQASSLSSAMILTSGGGDGAISTTATRSIDTSAKNSTKPFGSRRSKNSAQTPYHRLRSAHGRSKGGKQ